MLDLACLSVSMHSNLMFVIFVRHCILGLKVKVKVRKFVLKSAAAQNRQNCGGHSHNIIYGVLFVVTRILLSLSLCGVLGLFCVFF